MNNCKICNIQLKQLFTTEYCPNEICGKKKKHAWTFLSEFVDTCSECKMVVRYDIGGSVSYIVGKKLEYCISWDFSLEEPDCI